MLTKYQNFNQKFIILKERKTLNPLTLIIYIFADVAKQKNVVRPTTKKKRNMGKMLETLPT